MLRDLLAIDVYKMLLVFTRLGAGLMVMPVFGSANVPVRARLLLALALAVVLLPLLGPRLPPLPASPLALFLLVAGELTVGLFFGLMLQALMVPIDLAGNYISYSAGLTNAFVFDTNVMQQSQILASFLGLVGVTMIVVSDSHYLMLRGLVGTYDVFPPGQGVPLDDLSTAFLHTLGDCFMLGMELAAPLVVFALAFNTALGLMNRMVPQMQVFFVAMPVQILGGLSLLGISLSVIILWFLRHYQEGIAAFLPAG